MQCPRARLSEFGFRDGAGAMNNMRKLLNEHSLKQQVDMMGGTLLDVSTPG